MQRFRAMVGRHASALALITFSLASLAGAQQPASPLVGRWTLNVAKTHYGGGAEPRTRESLVCEPSDAAITCTSKSRRPDGRTVVVSFSARDDGTPARVHGAEDIDEVILTRVDSSITDATFKHRAQPVFAYRAVRALNGRSLIIISVDPVTRAVLHSVVVYDAR